MKDVPRDEVRVASTTTVLALAHTRRRSPWVSYLLRRGLYFLISLFVLVTLAFLLVQLIPGDPARASAGEMASPEIVEARRTELGLDLPMIVQYFRFWAGLFTGQLGDSFISRTPVIDIIATRAPATLELALAAVAIVLIVAIPLGLAFGALTRGDRRPFTQTAFTGVTAVLAVIPEFLAGIILVYLFAVNMQLLPVAGRSDFASYILPVVALAIGPTAALTRIVRAETFTVLEQDYVRTARAKRMSAARLYGRHVLPNLLTSTLTISGLLLGGMIAGTVLVENIFAWPGLGGTIVSSIQGKDYPLVQAIIIFYGAVVLLINLVVDILLILLDPRTALDKS
ncbi:peptide/nickel transport system permease protein [Microbacterium murale]|uniref:Peptide/nickel transport system permease protein n=1 Tax=Microbacterium murale TaxID=1081040 RepID=A0ABU0P950_9MICO|nr:peptide/nickel transport system permease protein [Microbacterium murale]